MYSLLLFPFIFSCIFSQCRDLHTSCDLFVSLDLCNTTSQLAIMKYNCAKSCSFCGVFVGDCVDRLTNCDSYKSSGLCETDDKLRVEYACSKTCNVCSSPV
ncbi:unnamed protein product [Caenorhabditis angaria]|uniref:ShKT domain-containing protein n=1 Tax=Caenorhabditis angaria TaxID=860376 RepID=A0A9P1IXL2_9PELO|nr:unnamed protein product [Caenorhabditis angaria]